MKFNKKLYKIADKYHHSIPEEFWFNYKGFKKILNDILRLKRDCIGSIYANDACNDDCCCICLENDDLMQTFCCRNKIHHICLFQVLSSPIASCPLCRADIFKVLQYRNNKEYYHAKIISLLSILHININKIEAVIKDKLISKKYLPVYIEYNRLAIIKMCKKIDKNLHINCKQFFIDLMNKHGMLKATNEAKQAVHQSLLQRIYILFRRVMTNI